MAIVTNIVRNARALPALLALVIPGAGVAACGAAPEPTGAAAQASSTGIDPNNAVRIVPTGDNVGIVSATLSKRFFDDETRDACGGDYSVDADVEVGRVTDDSIEVRAVTFHYRPNAHDEAPDAFMSFSSRGTSGSTVFTAGAEGEGDVIVQRFEVQRVFEGVRASDGGGVILEHRTRLQLGDRFEVCGMTMKVVLQT